MQSIALMIGLTMVATAVPAEPQRGRWITLGTATLRLDSSQGIIRVRGTDRYRQVRLCVERRAVRIETARVEFARGTPQVLNVRRTVGAGNCTTAETLRRPNMRTVRLNVGRQNHGARPIVSVQARW
ncbi:hypothetical protein FHS95_000691 [Sphingomonas naasensis]|uniref:DUF2541 family protein n=1 Tax=Sphingomonas naasensis TaxID=1344951 RepID=A0A4S1WU07_9SPHN|nr:hypothetical protein [Sphingomonas naasensis]NIJ19022.1 hypothetical protein [Sphingomonas naasensis]TGX46225.1 hypothetical protein E5A74_03450 [Sphingomonas naasensis]